MTRARAVELLKGIQFCCDFDDCTNAWDCDECVDAFNMAIEALEQESIKFYYVESLDDYWVGRRLDNFYYATWHRRFGFIWSHSKYLPWGEHIVDENTLWKEHTYPSEPKEIPFTEWIVGFTKKYFQQEPTAEYSSDVISRQAAIDTVMGFMPSLTTPDGCGQFDREIFEAQEMFVDIGQALNKLPSAQPFTTEQIQTMQELESAQVEKAYELGKADRPTGHWIENAQEYYEMINEKGGGVDENTPYFTDDIACSECLAKFSVIDNETERFDFCPNCGCAMKGGEEE